MHHNARSNWLATTQSQHAQQIIRHRNPDAYVKLEQVFGRILDNVQNTLLHLTSTLIHFARACNKRCVTEQPRAAMMNHRPKNKGWDGAC